MTRPYSTLPPLSEAEMRQMWHRGDPLAEIASKARLRNRIGRDQVRQIVFGETHGIR